MNADPETVLVLLHPCLPMMTSQSVSAVYPSTQSEYILSWACQMNFGCKRRRLFGSDAVSIISRSIFCIVLPLSTANEIKGSRIEQVR